MKRELVTLQVLAWCSLIAQDEQAAAQPPRVVQAPHRECAPLFQQGDDPILGLPITEKCPAAYSRPANVSVNAKQWDDLYGELSYLYWYVGEDSLDLAVPGFVSDSDSFPNGQAIFQDFDYTSGFRIGFGANLHADDWVADLEYTYVRQHTSTSNTAPATTIGTAEFFPTGWFAQTYYGFGPAAPAFSSKWKFGLDWLDLTFKRPFYQGLKFIVTPAAGLRASWIRQNLRIFAPALTNPYGDHTASSVSKNKSNSWALGPRGVIDARWLVGRGFRFQGNLGASLLFTQFTKVSHFETGSVIDEATAYPDSAFSFTNYNCLRPMAEANLGIGWGQYIYKNRYHVDLVATYDFNYLWGQNMMKYLVAIAGGGRNGTADNLVLHGLELKGRFDF